MIIRINQTAGVPLYMQIRDQLVEAIARGELRPGDGLPSACAGWRTTSASTCIR